MRARPVDVMLGTSSSESAVHPVLRQLFAALEQNRVRWCVLRGEDRLDGTAGDVDILVAGGDRERLRRIASELGFARIPSWGYVSHLFLLAYDPRSDRWLKLDVVSELAFGPYYSLLLPAADESLLHRRTQDGVALLSDSDAYWALALHALLDKREVTDSQAARLKELEPRTSGRGAIERELTRLAPDGWIGRFKRSLERGESVGFGQYADELSRAWTRRQRGASWRRRIAGFILRRAAVVLRLRQPRGMGVVLRPTGQAAMLAADLRRSFYFPVRWLSAEAAGRGPASLLAEMTRRLRFRLMRSRGALIVLDCPAPSDEDELVRCGGIAPDVVIAIAPGNDRGQLRREVTAALWQALAAQWKKNESRANHR
ncbi:MAG: hypothetical protein ACRDGV_00760 [Candidatus Limnocylindria bacterium]